jgi:hypothetical protein
MRGVNDPNFFNAWQILHRETCPSPTHSLWHAGDVEWRKDRHSFFGSLYAVSNEVHTLRRSAPNGGWVLMVVIENWWDGRRESIKTTTWARAIEGSAKDIIAWMRARERNGARAVSEAPRRAP